MGKNKKCLECVVDHNTKNYKKNVCARNGNPVQSIPNDLVLSIIGTHDFHLFPYKDRLSINQKIQTPSHEKVVRCKRLR